MTTGTQLTDKRYRVPMGPMGPMDLLVDRNRDRDAAACLVCLSQNCSTRSRQMVTPSHPSAPITPPMRAIIGPTSLLNTIKAGTYDLAYTQNYLDAIESMLNTFWQNKESWPLEAVFDDTNFVRMLINNASVKYLDGIKTGLPHLIVQFGRASSLIELLNRNSICATLVSKHTLLHLVISFGRFTPEERIQAIVALIEHGVNVNAALPDGRTAMDLLNIPEANKLGYTHRFLAIQLLVNAGAKCQDLMIL